MAGRAFDSILLMWYNASEITLTVVFINTRG